MNTPTESEDMQTLAQYRGFLKDKITKWRGGHWNEQLPPEETDWFKIIYKPKNHKEAGYLGLRFLLDCLRISDAKHNRQTWVTQRDMAAALEQWLQTKNNGGQPTTTRFLAKRFFYLCGILHRCRKVSGNNARVWQGVTFAPDFIFSANDSRGDHTPTIGTHLAQIRPIFPTGTDGTGKN